jgi:hypothetical protein
MLNKFEIEYCKPVSTPIVTGCKLCKEDEYKETYQSLYRSMTRNLLYVTTSRINIMQAVGLVGRFEVAPKETHVQAVKRIFRYLKVTLEFGLWYPKGEDFNLIECTDAYWVGNVDDRKRTSGGEFFLGIFLVSWLNKKQSSISLSIEKS